MLQLPPCPSKCLLLLSKSELSGVVASAGAASASEEGAKESEFLLFVSTVSKPPTIFFLLINLLTPPYCLHLGGLVEGQRAASGEGRTADNLSSEA